MAATFEQRAEQIFEMEQADCCIQITDLGVQAVLKILYRDKCLGPHQTTTCEEVLDACEKWMREIQPTLPRTDDARGDAACRDVIIVSTLLLTFRPEEEDQWLSTMMHTFSV
jgi:hypothetical protein